MIRLTALALFAVAGASLLGALPVAAQVFHHGEDRNYEDTQQYKQQEARRVQRDQDRRDRDWQAHERRAYDWRRAHEDDPGYVYAPPAVVYAPPPPASFSLTIPLDIR